MKILEVLILKSRKIYISILILVIIAIVYILCVFIGPPFGKMIARHKVYDYEKSVYGTTQPIDEIVYNLVTSNYIVKFKNKNFKLRYDPYKNMLTDELFQDKVIKKLSSDYREVIEFFPNTIEFPKSHIFTRIIANGEYDDIDNLKVSQKLYLLGIVNRDANISIEESMRKPAEITTEVIRGLGNNYNITGVQVIYIDINGVFEIDDEFNGTLSNNLEGITTIVENIGSEDADIINSIRLSGIN